MEYYFDRNLNENERIEELKAILARGNQNSAKTQPEELEIEINREVTYGFDLPIWSSNISKISKAILQVCGLVTQLTLSETGERKKSPG